MKHGKQENLHGQERIAIGTKTIKENWLITAPTLLREKKVIWIFNEEGDTTMTQKEKLASEYVELKKQFQGEFFLENARENQIWYLTKGFKVIDLEDKIKSIRRSIGAKAAREAKEAWFKTSEGKAWKEANEKAQQENWDAQEALRKEAYDYARNQVRTLLGDDFDVTRFRFGCFEVGLIKEYREDGMGVAYFGHDFTVYFENDCFSKDFKWELNYGCLGSFELGQDMNRAKFLMGLATFVNSSVVSGGFKEKMKEYTDKNDALRKEGWRLKEEEKKLEVPA